MEEGAASITCNNMVTAGNMVFCSGQLEGPPKIDQVALPVSFFAGL